MLVWLMSSTRPNLANVVSLLGTYTHSPSQGFLDAAHHVGRHLKSTIDQGIKFSLAADATLEAFVRFSIKEGDDILEVQLTVFCDANWGPQDVSQLNSKNARLVLMDETRSVLGHLIMLCGGPILWKARKEKQICGSSCQSKVNATDQCRKDVQHMRHVLKDLQLLSINPTII